MGGCKLSDNLYQYPVRRSLPFTTRCNTCGNCMLKRTKFNCEIKCVAGETYMGFKIFRFYTKCTSCSAQFVLKTDPENSNYVVEAGATRISEPFRDQDVKFKLSEDAGVQTYNMNEDSINKEPSDSEASTSKLSAADYCFGRNKFKSLSLAEPSDGAASTSHPPAADYTIKGN